jgi:hypothetical protein
MQLKTPHPGNSLNYKGYHWDSSDYIYIVTIRKKLHYFEVDVKEEKAVLAHKRGELEGLFTAAAIHNRGGAYSAGTQDKL